MEIHLKSHSISQHQYGFLYNMYCSWKGTYGNQKFYNTLMFKQYMHKYSKLYF